jgi:hypothetical protein
MDVTDLLTQQIFNIGLSIIFGLFAVIVLVKYIQNKTKVALYLSLNYFSYMIAMILIAIGIEVSSNRAERIIYIKFSDLMQMAATIGAIMIYYFYRELSNVSYSRVKIITFFGVVLEVILLLSVLFSFVPRPLIYTYMLFFFGYIYFQIATSFLLLQKRIEKNKFAFLLIGFGAFIFIIYFILKAFEGSLNIWNTFALSNFLLLLSQSLFLIGFLAPMIKKNR